MTVLKQRCREHGITRWPYRKVKKLDTIINALGGAAGEDTQADATDADRRLSAVKRTRESLITDPNSDAHLRVGKLKTIRRRLSSGSGSGSGDEDSFGSDGGARAGSGSGASGQTTLARPRAARLSERGGVDGLLEAAASLSDGEETPGTPTRDPDGIRDRSPRISGLLSAIDHERLNAANANAAGEAAAALGALFRPAGGAGAFAPVKPSAVGERAALSAPESAMNLPAAITAALDPKAYAAALAAFVQGMSAAAAPVSSTPWTAAASASAASAAAPQTPPHALFAWMAAMSAAPPPPIAAPPVPQWNAETLQRLAESMQAVTRVGMTAATAATAVTAPIESAHQPL